MALTPSSDFPIGTKAPDFSLPDPLSGRYESLQQLKGIKGTVVAFICNHCPYVIHIEKAFIALAQRYQNQEIAFIAISANSEHTHPQDGPQAMANKAKEHNYPFPYLFDESQQVARAYNAACTPDIYLFDKHLACTYHGQFDETRPNSGQTAHGTDLQTALDTLLADKPPLDKQQPSIGCNIKWHS